MHKVRMVVIKAGKVIITVFR